MFTIKFYKHSDGDVICETISVPNYTKLKRSNGSVLVTAYPKLTNENGVDRWVIPESTNEFTSFFVENHFGKTVDGFGSSL